ncbi:unnamed protein product [Camellia sinensis]
MRPRGALPKDPHFNAANEVRSCVGIVREDPGDATNSTTFGAGGCSEAFPIAHAAKNLGYGVKTVGVVLPKP